jgi:hypothetical protein
MSRYDYSKIALVKKDGITKFDDNGIDNFTSDVVNGLANYGFFVMLTRSLAGHEKETDIEKKAIVKAVYEMLLSGKMRTGKKIGMTAEEKAKLAKDNAIEAMRKAATTPAEKKLIESIIAKM